MAASSEPPAIIELQVRPPNDDRELLLQRICDLEMDNEILKQQLIFVTAEMRQNFMELAEKIDKVDSKLSSTMKGSTVVMPTTKSRTTSSGIADSQKFDAMTCVETIMETSDQLLNTSFDVKEEPVNIDEPTGTGSTEERPDRHHVEAVPFVANGLPCTSEVDLNNNEIGSAIDAPPKRHCCTICNKTFCQSSGLNRHQKIHLKQQQDSLLKSDVDKFAKPKRFFCTAPFCKRGFTTRSGMTKHAKSVHRDPSIKPLIIPLVDLQAPMSSAFLVPVPVEPLLNLNGTAEDAIRVDHREEKAVVVDANEDMDEMV